MLNLNLVKNILIIGISAGVITTALVQKIKYMRLLVSVFR